MEWGLVLSEEGYKIDNLITEAIFKFPPPSNCTDLRSFFGLVNQLSASTNTIAGLLAPLRPLLSTKNDFVWTAEHDQAFKRAKESLTIAPTLAFFDIDRPTCLSTDASRQGLGFVLQQKKQRTSGSLSRQDLDSLQMQSHDMLSSSLSYLLSHGPCQNAAYS